MALLDDTEALHHADKTLLARIVESFHCAHRVVGPRLRPIESGSPP
jgi:hypothetical protein